MKQPKQEEKLTKHYAVRIESYRTRIGESLHKAIMDLPRDKRRALSSKVRKVLEAAVR